MLKISLRSQLTLIISGIFLMVVVVTGSIFTYQEQKALIGEHTRRIITIAEVMADQIKMPVVTNDLRLIYKNYINTLKYEGVEYIIIEDHEGKVLAHEKFEEIGKQHTDNLSIAARKAEVPSHINYIQQSTGDGYCRRNPPGNGPYRLFVQRRVRYNHPGQEK